MELIIKNQFEIVEQRCYLPTAFKKTGIEVKGCFCFYEGVVWQFPYGDENCNLKNLSEILDLRIINKCFSNKKEKLYQVLLQGKPCYLLLSFYESLAYEFDVNESQFVRVEFYFDYYETQNDYQREFEKEAPKYLCDVVID